MNDELQKEKVNATSDGGDMFYFGLQFSWNSAGNVTWSATSNFDAKFRGLLCKDHEGYWVELLNTLTTSHLSKVFYPLLEDVAAHIVIRLYENIRGCPFDKRFYDAAMRHDKARRKHLKKRMAASR